MPPFVVVRDCPDNEGGPPKKDVLRIYWGHRQTTHARGDEDCQGKEDALNRSGGRLKDEKVP